MEKLVKRINQKELVKRTVKRLESEGVILSYAKVNIVARALFGTIEQHLIIGDSVMLKGFGKIHTVKRKARAYTDFRGNRHNVPEHRLVAFHVSPVLKARM